MTNTKHTPAPWQYDAQRHEIYGANGKGELIATSVYGADAALIAAAPRMLAVLELVKVHDGKLTGADRSEIVDTIDIAKGGTVL